MRRVPASLPRIDRLTDAYNAVSVPHLMPIGGEDLSGYEGPPRLVVADGRETFETVTDGQPANHTATAGEIIWRVIQAEDPPDPEPSAFPETG